MNNSQLTYTTSLLLIFAFSFAFNGCNSYANQSHKNEINETKKDIQSTDETTFGRLATYPKKTEVSCPSQTNNTEILLIIGQSNTVNLAGQRYKSAYGDKVINYFEGKCFIAESPLLGTQGKIGESWTLLGNKLIENGLAERVILISSGIAGTEIKRWMEEGDLNKMLMSVIDSVKQHYKITKILWHQGESDFTRGTSEIMYTEMFYSLLDSIRKKEIDAPIYVSIASKCGFSNTWKEDNPVANAQRLLPDKSKRIFKGVNTDTLIEQIDRYDQCHFSGSGQEKFANGWLEVIKNSKP